MILKQWCLSAWWDNIMELSELHGVPMNALILVHEYEQGAQIFPSYSTCQSCGFTPCDALSDITPFELFFHVSPKDQNYVHERQQHWGCWSLSSDRRCRSSDESRSPICLSHAVDGTSSLTYRNHVLLELRQSCYSTSYTSVRPVMGDILVYLTHRGRSQDSQHFVPISASGSATIRS